MLKKEVALWPRDEKGETIPVLVEVPELGGEILVKPITYGYWKRFVNESIARKSKGEEFHDDAEIVANCCVEPKYTVKELSEGKSNVVEAMAKAILRASGLLSDGGEKLPKSSSSVAKGKSLNSSTASDTTSSI